MKKFEDFATTEGYIDGDKIKIEEVINREIAVIGYAINDSKYNKNNSGKCLTLQFILEENTKIIFTGSDVLISQMEKYNKEIPFLTTIKKINKFYTLT